MQWFFQLSEAFFQKWTFINVHFQKIPNTFEKSKEERVADIKPIITKLNELGLNMSLPAVKRLYKEIAEYMKDGNSRKINIPIFSIL